nr:phosphopantetheinyltransferase component of enterobactin synthase multienzyme complex [Klebsiella pneumoniae]
MAHARFGSISHCGQRALAVIADRPVGVDIERRFTPQLAAELESSIIGPAEKRRCCTAACPSAGADAGVFGEREWV